MISFKGYDHIIQRVYNNGQEHIFNYWDRLSDEEKILLLNDVADVDFHLLQNLYSRKEPAMEMDYTGSPYVPVPVSQSEAREHDEAARIGVDFIRKGKVGAFIVAGGQGSRLGYEGPKGKFPLGPVSGKTLFQMHGEKIYKYSEKYGVPIPWLIMTSKLNHEETTAYFEEKNFFGLGRDDVMIFQQNMIPSLDAGGKLVLETRCTIFKNPDGHGGSLTAMATSGALGALKKRGIEVISYFQVDNPIVKIIDPAFIGYHVMKGAVISSKGVKKAYPEEKMGVFVRYSDGRTGIVEYSDLPKEKMYEKDGTGGYRISMGSVAIHLFDLGFIGKVTGEGDVSLPFHTARKKIRAFSSGDFREIEGLKFEKFVFDALLLTDRNLVFETRREEEFAPVKNADGVDSVETARVLMNDLYRGWLKKAGITVPGKDTVIEISPLRAVEPGDLSGIITVPDAEKVYIE